MIYAILLLYGQDFYLHPHISTAGFFSVLSITYSKCEGWDRYLYVSFSSLRKDEFALAITTVCALINGFKLFNRYYF